jgi:arginyl-tRNA synthetase
MPTVAAHLTTLVRTAAERAGLQIGAEVEPVVPTRDAAHGDYQSNLAFRLAKSRGMKPVEAASALRDAFPADPAVARVEVAGAGFLNLTLTDDWLAADVLQRVADPRLGTPASGAGRTLVLDYSSPNIAKRMHVGHLGSTLIGGAMDRIYRFLGWNVVTDNHLGDWGTPYGKLMVAWEDWRDEAAYARDPVGELQRLYELAGAKIEEDPTLLQRARAATVKLQARDPATLALWQQFVDVSLAEFRALYERLGCRFDQFLGESAYADALQPLVDELLATGVAIESEGAVVIRFGESDGKALTDQTLVIRKADGAALYGTTDLATIRHRMATWSPERIVYVVDTRQQAHFRQVFAAARRMGIADVELVHLWFGMLKLPGGIVAAARAGNAGNLVDLLDTAASKAFDVVTLKSPDLPEEERRQIAEIVGIGTIKYFVLSQNPQTDVTFTWERALSPDGGSAVYLLYAYARLHSMLRLGGAADKPPTVAPSLAHPAERALGVLVARTPEIVFNAGELYRPNILAEHLEALAKAVGAFYESCPVLKDDVAPDLRAARLSLVFAVARTLEIGLDLLGVRVVPRM